MSLWTIHEVIKHDNVNILKQPSVNSGRYYNKFQAVIVSDAILHRHFSASYCPICYRLYVITCNLYYKMKPKHSQNQATIFPKL